MADRPRVEKVQPRVPQKTRLERILDSVERVGNKVPHPGVIFVWLIITVILLSHLLYLVGSKATYDSINPDTHQLEHVTTPSSIWSSPGIIPKWAVFAPVFVPLLMRLHIQPEAVLAAYRVGDSPLNAITPMMAYFPLIVGFAAKYQKSAGVGTVVAMMLPYVVVIQVVWILLLVVWQLLGIPWGF